MSPEEKLQYWMKLVARHGAESCVRELLDMVEQQNAMLDAARDLLSSGLGSGVRPAVRKPARRRHPTGRGKHS